MSMETVPATVAGRMERAADLVPLEERYSLDDNCMVMAPDLSFEEWLKIGNGLGSMERGLNWWMGDWLNYGERKYGEKYAQAVSGTGRSIRTLMNVVYVCGRIPKERRRASLSFSVHAEVAALEAPVQDRLLAQAEQAEWTREEMRQAVRDQKRLTAGSPAALASPQTNGNGAHAPSPPPEPSGAVPAEYDPEADGGENLAAELLDAHEQIRRLEDRVTALSTGDTETELGKWQDRYDALEGRLQQAMAEHGEAVKQASSQEKVLKKLRALLKVERNSQLVEAVKALLSGS